MPALSLLVLWLVSVLFLWAARAPMLQMLRGFGKGIDEGMCHLSRWCRSSAEDLQERSRQVLLAAAHSELLSRLEREFHRVDLSFAKDLGLYSRLHRKLDDILNKLAADYEGCIDSPPQAPGWDSAVKTVAKIPAQGNPGVEKVLDGIRESLREGEKKALQQYRESTAKRHRLLAGMAPAWREVRGLMARMTKSVGKALETSSKIDRYVTDYEQILRSKESAARVLTYSAMKSFIVSLIVLAVAFGGAFINFQLIALPMSELVPSGARIGSLPVATVSALVIVCMEVVVGIFVMDMLGITELFPRLSTISASRRHLILAVALGGLFFLASVESSLAILREKIVEADAALKMALAGSADTIVGQATSSKIPVIGQAVLGFILPWILAMVAIPLEMCLDSGRHVLATLAVLALYGLANLARLVGQILRYLGHATEHLYDVYISIPLRIERMVGRESTHEPDLPPPTARATEASLEGGGIAQ
jgi:hypothetical protein